LCVFLEFCEGESVIVHGGSFTELEITNPF
jgi:hypothetical protein